MTEYVTGCALSLVSIPWYISPSLISKGERVKLVNGDAGVVKVSVFIWYAVGGFEFVCFLNTLILYVWPSVKSAYVIEPLFMISIKLYDVLFISIIWFKNQKLLF